MNEIGMNSEDEGVSLKQLIPLYKKYRISYHCLNYKYHVAASHYDHDYKTNTNYSALFYVINYNHLFPITGAAVHRSNKHEKYKALHQA